MKKSAVFFFSTLFFLLFALPSSALSDESAGSAPERTEEETAALSAELYTDELCVYDYEIVTVRARLTGAEGSPPVRAAWSLNGAEVEGYVNGAFEPFEGKESTFRFVVPQGSLGTLAVAFTLSDPEGETLASASLSLTPQGWTPVGIERFSAPAGGDTGKKISLSALLYNQNGRHYLLPASFAVKTPDGKETLLSSAGVLIDRQYVSVYADYLPDGSGGADYAARLFFRLGASDAPSAERTVDFAARFFSKEMAIEAMRKKIVTAKVECTALSDLSVYATLSLSAGGKPIASRPKGTAGVYINYSDKAAKVVYPALLSPDGKVLAPAVTGWVKKSLVSISSKLDLDPDDPPADMKELFVNTNGYKSDTNYLIWISLRFQRVNTFEKTAGGWKLIRSSPCSTGKNQTPTTAGVFRYFRARARWDFGSYYVSPVMIFNGGAALHSRTYRPNGTLLDPTLGTPVSDGCARLPDEEINWLFKTIPLQTTVVVF